MNSYWLPLNSVEPIEVFAADGAGAPITGMLDMFGAVRRESDGQWLDFFDMTFKAVGWVVRQVLMAEFDPALSPGFYRFIFDTTSFPADDYVIVAQQIPATVFLQTVVAELRVGGVPDDVVLTRKIGQNRLDMSAGGAANWVLYDDNSITPLLTFDVKDATGGPISPPVGAPARRSRGV